MTKIGILSDSHGRGPITHLAAKMLVERGAQLLVHLGDICSTAVMDALIQGYDGQNNPWPPIRIVFGNCDEPCDSLARYAREMKLQVDHPMGVFEIAGRKIAITHGHRGDLMKQAMVTMRVDYLLHGHTHLRRDERVGHTRIINPGALHRATSYTVAMLDAAGDHLDFFNLDVAQNEAAHSMMRVSRQE